MKWRHRKWVRLLLGWGFILLGIAGLFLPILQGILFLAIGLVILSFEYQWAEDLLVKAKKRFPRFAPHVHQAHEKARSWFHPTAGNAAHAPHTECEPTEPDKS